PGFHALHPPHDLGQTFVRQLLQRRETRAQQLALLHCDTEPDAPFLERADQLVIDGGHREAVANHLVESELDSGPPDRLSGPCKTRILARSRHVQAACSPTSQTL